VSAADPLAELAPLIEEMAARGYLDAWIVRHHPEAPAYVKSAVQRLTAKIGYMLGDGTRQVIRAQELEPLTRPAVTSVVACALVETVNKLVDPEPVAALLDQINGRHRLIATAAHNRVVSETRKARVRTRMLVAVEEVPEPVAVDEAQAPELPQLPAEWEAAACRLEARGVKVNQRNLARELGISERHLRRRMSAFRTPTR